MSSLFLSLTERLSVLKNLANCCTDMSLLYSEASLIYCHFLDSSSYIKVTRYVSVYLSVGLSVHYIHIRSRHAPTIISPTRKIFKTLQLPIYFVLISRTSSGYGYYFIFYNKPSMSWLHAWCITRQIC